MDTACGQCKGCILRGAGNHPDFFELLPEEGKNSIGVDAAREVSGFLTMTSFAGGYKVALVDPAEIMTVNASNSLLKTLEEPPGNSILILVSEQPAGLPATVRSRCQEIRFAAPDKDKAIAWLDQSTGSSPEPQHWEILLDFAGGAPLKAMNLADEGFYELNRELHRDIRALVDGDSADQSDPIAVAARWNKLQPAICLDWLIRQVQILIKINTGANICATNAETSATHLQNHSRPLHLRRLFAYLDQIQRVRSLLGKPVNMQLAFEALLIPWCHRLELLPELTG
jgi:DNA polymerase-3 subunit delta'